MYKLVALIVKILKKIIPERVVSFFRPAYHKTLARMMAFSYGFPARELFVIGVTGTKGKSTVAEMVFAILHEAGFRAALLSTVRFAICETSEPNLHKMTLPGRGFAQSFMRRARNAGCTHCVIEITSESVLQYRHWFLDLDALVVTNIQREHIESHGSFGNYVAAKRAIVDALARSSKRHTVLVANSDIPESRAFLSAKVSSAVSFCASDIRNIVEEDKRVSFTYANTVFAIPCPGTFNAMNALAAVKLGESLQIPIAASASALAKMPVVRGRVENIDAGQDFLVVVDYAHTPDSLSALYDTFRNRCKICVLGNTGGGRDKWKRPEMGRIADKECETVILTNEDPYDENPRAIVDEMAEGMLRKPKIIMDRREAIRAALRAARPGDAVLISGKGTDPFIMGPQGTKMPWSDADVVRDELSKMLPSH